MKTGNYTLMISGHWPGEWAWEVSEHLHSIKMPSREGWRKRVAGGRWVDK